MTTSIISIAIFELFSIQFIRKWDAFTERHFELNKLIEQSDEKKIRYKMNFLIVTLKAMQCDERS